MPGGYNEERPKWELFSMAQPNNTLTKLFMAPDYYRTRKGFILYSVIKDQLKFQQNGKKK